MSLNHRDTERRYEFIKKYWWRLSLQKRFRNFLGEYLEWIRNSKLNNLLNLQGYKSLQYVHGTSQSFDFLSNKP